jgi:phytoene desaturase
MRSNKNIVIIGAGLSGLSAAPLLAKDGFHVLVVEKNSNFGGVAGRFLYKGYSFDSGPTWYLMPEVFEYYFSLFKKSHADYYNLIQLDPSYRVFFNKEEWVDIRSDVNHNAGVFDSLEFGGGNKLKQYLAKAEYKYNIAYNEFLYRNYNSIFDFLNKKFLFEGIRLHVFRNLDSYVKKYFKNKKTAQILEFNTVFLGSSPDRIPALYSLMSHADIKKGVMYPQGGIYKLSEALYSLGKEYGVEYFFDHKVERIHIKNNKAISVQTNHDIFEADIVLATADYHHTETELLDKKYQSYSERYWKKRTLAPTAFLMYVAVEKKIPVLEHHNLYLAQNWENHFQAIFKKPSWPDNPSYYIGCPSKTDSTVSPPQCESLFILVPVAPDLDDNEEVKEKFSNAVISHFEELIGEPVKNFIVFKKILSHSNFKTGYNLYKGTSMGLAHTLFQTAVFRPSHKSKKVSNLYYTGHYTHPGIGMPMVIISSQIVSQLIREKHG